MVCRQGTRRHETGGEFRLREAVFGIKGRLAKERGNGPPRRLPGDGWNAMKRACSRRGFSLVELLITLALIAVMATIAVPQFQRYSTNADLKTAAREVMADLFAARQMAVENSVTSYRMTFDVGGNSYVLSRTPPAAWENVWTAPKSLASFGSGIRLVSVNFSGGSTVNFQRRGTVSGGNLTLTNRLGSTAAITVNITGRTYVQYTMQ